MQVQSTRIFFWRPALNELGRKWASADECWWLTCSDASFATCVHPPDGAHAMDRQFPAHRGHTTWHQGRYRWLVGSPGPKTFWNKNVLVQERFKFTVLQGHCQPGTWEPPSLGLWFGCSAASFLCPAMTLFRALLELQYDACIECREPPLQPDTAPCFLCCQYFEHLMALDACSDNTMPGGLASPCVLGVGKQWSSFILFLYKGSTPFHDNSV